MKSHRLLLAALMPALSLGVHAASDFPAPYNTEPDTNSFALPAAEAAAKWQVPAGFKATAFASEPEVQNPIAMTWDGRGRLWVAENYTYAERTLRFDMHLRDRLVIFEDRNGDGHFSSRKVFTDDVQMLTSVEVGHGGVWLMCPPQLIFIPDKNHDDIPDGPPQVILDGFSVPWENYHNFANGLHFGPDGWLYGRCGASSPGEIGAPGTPAGGRIPLRGTVWRYHPQRKVFEALSSGCTNPWGHDWNERGELFFINTVNGQLWHQITGAHYVRPHTIDHNTRAYELIDQHADHWHFDTAKKWSDSREGAANDYGGGHAHIGEMIYLGDNWPSEYRGRLFTWNFHGRRANQEILERTGSGYVGHHGADLFFAADKWFRGMELSYGPDGGVMALDWSDTGECHESTGVHRTSGRIYKITYGDPKRQESFDLSKMDSLQLVELHLHRNEWFARKARLQLTERALAGQDLGAATSRLRALFQQNPDVIVKLRCLWTLYAMGAADETFLKNQLRAKDESVRTWAVRLLTDRWALDTCLSQRPASAERPSDGVLPGILVQLAKKETSGLVRLALASTLQRLPVDQRSPLAAALTSHGEDAADHNLPLLIWYGLIPLSDTDPGELAKLGGRCELPTTRRLIARRLAEDIEKNSGPLNELLKTSAKKPANFQGDILAGISEGLAGWHKARKPAAWDDFAARAGAGADAAIRDRLRDLGVLFGDGRALDDVKRIALDKDAEMAARKAALQTLIENRPPDLRSICEQLLKERFLNKVAVRGLAQFDDPAVGEQLARSYRDFHLTEREAVLETLVARPAFAKSLLDEMAAGRIPRSDLTPFHARQIRSFNDEQLSRQLASVWGELRESAADKKAFMAGLKTRLTPAVLAAADPGRGRAVFNQACAACHTLYGHGGQVGPDLTGSGRDNLDYLLENIVDPSAVVSADFRMTVASLKDGRTLNGLIAKQTGRTVTLKTMTEVVTVERSEVEKLEGSPLSLMPEGLLEGLPEKDVRNLIAYLMTRSQVPLPPDAN